MNSIIQEIESDLNVSFPKHFIRLLNDKSFQNFSLHYSAEDWKFYSLNEITEKTLEFRKIKLLDKNDFAIAESSDGNIIFYRLTKANNLLIFYWNEETHYSYFAYSISEFLNVEKTEKILESIDQEDFKEDLLKEIADCPGSLFQVAYELYDSTLEWGNMALNIYHDLAKKGHPEAASEIANHYDLNDKIDKVIEWREKAIHNGNVDDMYPLVDYIIDYKPKLIDKAISILEELSKDSWFKERALIKLSEIYLLGIGGKFDIEKGIILAQENGDENIYLKLGSIASKISKGQGGKKNLDKAYQLAIRAEEEAIKIGKKGFWEILINNIKAEQKKTVPNNVSIP